MKIHLTDLENLQIDWMEIPKDTPLESIVIMINRTNDRAISNVEKIKQGLLDNANDVLNTALQWATIKYRALGSINSPQWFEQQKFIREALSNSAFKRHNFYQRLTYAQGLVNSSFNKDWDEDDVTWDANSRDNQLEEFMEGKCDYDKLNPIIKWAIKEVLFQIKGMYPDLKNFDRKYRRIIDERISLSDGAYDLAIEEDKNYELVKWLDKLFPSK